MPKCCATSLIPFAGQSATVINYTPDLRERFGPVPSVAVLYMDPPSQGLKRAVVAVSLDYPVTSIQIDHGGVMSGYIMLKR